MLKRTDGLHPARRLLSGFGLHLKETRRAHNITTRELEESLGIRADVINRVETGRWMPSVEQEQILREWMLQHPLPQPDGDQSSL
jgi:transcriptional regulator with XRE-family HTH domain